MELWIWSKPLFALLTLFEKATSESKVRVSAGHEQCSIFHSMLLLRVILPQQLSKI